MPKTANKQVVYYKLTRYACYLIIQSGDSRKEGKKLSGYCWCLQLFGNSE